MTEQAGTKRGREDDILFNPMTEQVGKKRGRGGWNRTDEDKDGLRLPKSTIKRIMKINSDVGAVSLTGVTAACHATELFLGYLAEKSGNRTQEDGRKILKLEDISAAIEDHPNLHFLKDAFGPPIPTASATAASSSPQSDVA